MRNKKAKEIRKILNLSENSDNNILRRTYRRIKKLYVRTSNKNKPALLKAIQKKFSYV
jgi:hypothetical protein